MEKEKKWYDNANIVTSLIIGLIIMIIIISQSFAVKYNIGALNTFRSLFNHNTTFIIGLIYFVMIKTTPGKRYFNIINLIYIGVYFLLLLASFLTIFQSFGIASLASLLVNTIMLLYMIYTFLYNTRLWKELKLDLIPFDEVSNDIYYYSITALSIIVLLVKLIEAYNFDGIILSIFDMLYIILFARYIYLYKQYEDSKKVKKGRKRK